METSQPLRQIRPLKNLGQNFLVDRGALRTIIEAADIKPSEVVLEIGPGTGVLTIELAKKTKKVIAVEKDHKLIPILEENLKEFKNVKIIHGDIMESDFPLYFKRNQISQKYKVVANLPYYITSPVIRLFLEKIEAKPQLMVLMVQKEVAQRICAKPPNMSILAVSVQFYAKSEIIDYVSRKSFWPNPKVNSAIIKIVPTSGVGTSINVDLFFKVVKAGFSHPRKQLINNLSTSLSLSRPQAQIWLQKAKIQPSQRAETLTVSDWIKLTKSLI